MDSDLKKIKKLTLFMKKEGLLELKQGDIELRLDPQFLTPKKSLDQTPEEPAPKYDPMAMALWSTPDYIPDEAN